MNFVATLISNPAECALSERIVEHAVAVLNQRSATGIASAWLTDNVACDLTFAAADANILKAEDLEGAPIDVVIQSPVNRRKQALIADMDSTIIEVECLDELADFAGLRQEISAITERTMRGELDFESALIERVQMLEGLTASALEETWNSRITLTPGARTLVQTMRATGAVTELISGGFNFFTSRVADAVGFDADHANELLVENGQLTGKVKMPILGADAKLTGLNRIRKEHDLSANDIMAVGDGANDIPMLDAAGAGVAFHAKPKTAASADMVINHGDLTALLYIQGFTQQEFVDA